MRTGQACLLIIFAGMLFPLFEWSFSAHEPVLDDSGGPMLFEEILTAMLFLPLGAILFFGLRYP